jgi:integrase/recombinase XerD
MSDRFFFVIAHDFLSENRVHQIVCKGETDMAKRRSNQLTKQELNKVMDTKELLTFEEALELFLKDCSIRNLRDHTLKYYSNELRAFLNVLKKQGLDLKPNEVTIAHIKGNVILFMKDQQSLKTVTINTRLRAIRSFFNFLHSNKHIKNNPVETVKLLKDRKQVVETFTRDELKKLLKQPDLHTFTGVRNYTIMLLFLETGVRANEFVNIHVSDIQENSIRIRNSKTYMERFVPIQRQMKDQLRKWLAIRGQCDHDFLFINIDGKPLAKRTVQQCVAQYGDKIGVNSKCHKFRHTFARMCVENGANVFELQRIMGHTTLEMTKQYVNLFSNEIIEGHRQFSPLKSIL